MFRPISIMFAAGMALLGASAAHAGTHWSVGINLPVPGVVVTNGGYYVSEPQRVYYAPAPVVRYAPVPVYETPPVYLAPQVYYSNEPPVYVLPYRAEPYRSWNGERYSRWQQHRDFERDRWEHARRGHDERHWERGEHGSDNGDADRWHHD